MAGISGMDDFLKGLDDFGKKVGRLDGLSVPVSPADTVSAVVEKLRREIRRTDAYEPTESELRAIAQRMIEEAKRRQ